MKKLLILSGKGGTGKTTTAAAFIRFAGARAVADCDVDAPNLALVSGDYPETRETDFKGSDKAKIDENLCIGCGKCAEMCRFGAISPPATANTRWTSFAARAAGCARRCAATGGEA
ncbi:MAG: 4Fe-4S binding protein [Oscillospiraceae bacterium]